MERTFTMIKPRANKENLTAPILKDLFEDGFRIIALKTIQLNKYQAEKFYAVHKERSFFRELINFMTSGPIVAIVLEKENAVESLRDLMGATNPEEAMEGTIRNKYGQDKQQNAIHGADSKENALREIQFFFSEHEL